MNPQIRIAHGPMAVEALLLDDLRALIQAARQDPGRLAQPVRLIVPSRSLRRHVAETLVRGPGRSVAGVLVQTLHGAAREILDRAGVAYLDGRHLFEVLVRRHAREEPVLRAGLDDLADGYASVAATVADFLDAGLEPEHGEALEERLGEIGGEAVPPELAGRAAALVRVAGRTAASMTALGAGVASSALRAAVAPLARHPDLFFPARAVLIHGYADATGAASDLLEALARNRTARIYWDHPPDPADPREVDPAVRFTQRLFERLRGLFPPPPPSGAPPPPPELRAFRAPGAHPESREVARRIARLLELGASPHRIGVVARDLTAYRIPIRLHFEDFGIPFSGIGATAGPPDARGRRMRALGEMLARQGRTTVDQWLELSAEPLAHDLRLALHALGAGRISDAAALELDGVVGPGDLYPLPVRRGLGPLNGDDGDGGGPHAPRRTVPSDSVRNLVRLAGALIRRWKTWPAPAGFAVHAQRLRALLVEELAWLAETPGVGEVLGVVEDLARSIPEGFSLGYEEFVLLMARGLSDAAGSPLGGRGGGVQVLNVMEARGRTFDHLFVMGLNRDVFPRPVREDPLLPDSLRRELTPLLPDLPIKRLGVEEERYLFAQLLASSPRITLSWKVVDDDGRALSASPLVERMRLNRGWPQTETIPPPHAPPASRGASSEPPGAVPVHDHAVIAGLHGSRAHFSRIFPFAAAAAQAGMEESRDPWLEPHALARARLAVLDEMDPDHRTPQGRARAARLGPYFGFAGPPASSADPRHARLYVSTLEGMARCPWRLFLMRLLRLQPVPDALGALPDLDPPLLGITVHAVLEEVVREALTAMPGTMSDASLSGALPLPRPGEEVQGRILSSAARRAIRQAGIGLEGLVRVLESRARPFLQVAWETDWPQGQPPPLVMAAEIRGEVMVEDQGGASRSILFMADRVDRAGDGLRLTDYKTGRAIHEGVLEKTRRDHFLKAVERGERLQAVAYVLGAGIRPAEGRYVFLKPEVPQAARVFAVGPDADFAEAFRRAVGTLLAALDGGVFFPRLVGPDGQKEPRVCERCEVNQACLRGDSGARRRLISALDRIQDAASRGRGLAHAEAALLGVWSLGAGSRRARIHEQGEGPP